MSTSSTSSPEMQRRPDTASLSSTMGTGARSDSRGNETQSTEAAASTTKSASSFRSKTGCFDALAAVLLVQISSFSPGSNLSGVCRSTLLAIRKLHYKIDLKSCYSIENLEEHMGVQESGALATGRVVTRITVLVGDQRCGGWEFYKASEEAVKRVVRHSIPTLRRITVSGSKGRRITISGGIGWQDGRSRVAPIIGELVPLSNKRRRVAPQLRHVELVAGATGVAKAGKAVAAGLWPALKVLKFSHCRANASQFEELAHGLRTGRAPHLRVLDWDDQSCIRIKPVDDVILSALAWGRCPRIKSLSFTGNHFCPEHRILYLKDALKACPSLLTLEMDCSRRPCVQLRDLTRSLREGHLPNLEGLFVRATAPYYRGSDVELKALREAAASREPPVMLVSEIKTRLPPTA